MNSSEIAKQNNDRAEQNVLAILADGLSHAFESSESLTKACRRLARRGVVTMSPLRPRVWAVKLVQS